MTLLAGLCFIIVPTPQLIHREGVAVIMITYFGKLAWHSSVAVRNLSYSSDLVQYRKVPKF